MALDFFSPLVAFLHFALAIGVTLHTLLHKREVSAAIGWIGLAWLAPFMGAALYLGFGISRVKRRAQRLKGAKRPGEAPRSGDRESTDPIERLKVAVGGITGLELSTGAVVAILDSGDHGYPQMLEAIDNAKRSISLCTFIFRDDALGEKFIAALGRAHRRGAKVRVLIDGFGGGFLLSPAYHRLRKEGVVAARFLHSLLPWQMPFLDLQDAQEMSRRRRRRRLRRRPQHRRGKPRLRRIRNPRCATVTFASKARSSGRSSSSSTTIGSSRRGRRRAAPEPSPPPALERMSPTRAIVTGPDQEAERLVLVLLSAIGSARKSIRIATPYFVPDEQLVSALGLAALRGVAVNIVLPERNNHWLVGWAVPPHIRPLLLAGCDIWRSPPPFDHSKLMTIDGEWSLIGSANWDMRSLRLNFEMTVESYDREFAEALARRIDARCVERWTLSDIDGRLLVTKLRDAAARLTMPYI